MPIYAYRCKECANDFEARQRFSDDPLTECHVCGTEGSVFRVIQPAGVVFKGSGFYVTDTRGASTTLPAKSENDSGKTEKPASETASDSKTDSKTPNAKSETTAKTESKPVSGAAD